MTRNPNPNYHKKDGQDRLVKTLDTPSECFDRGYLGGSLEGHAEGYEQGYADAVTACATRVRAMGQQWYAEAKKRGAAFSDKGRWAETTAKELESITRRDLGTVSPVDISDDELLSCPFCGGRPKIQNNGNYEIVMCLNGDCYFQPSVRDRKTKSARETWNTRVIDHE